MERGVYKISLIFFKLEYLVRRQNVNLHFSILVLSWMEKKDVNVSLIAIFSAIKSSRPTAQLRQGCCLQIDYLS